MFAALQRRNESARRARATAGDRRMVGIGERAADVPTSCIAQLSRISGFPCSPTGKNYDGPRGVARFVLLNVADAVDEPRIFTVGTLVRFGTDAMPVSLGVCASCDVQLRRAFRRPRRSHLRTTLAFVVKRCRRAPPSCDGTHRCCSVQCARSRRLRTRSSCTCPTSRAHAARLVESCADVIAVATIDSNSGAARERRIFRRHHCRVSTSPAPRVVGRACRDEVAGRPAADGRRAPARERRTATASPCMTTTERFARSALRGIRGHQQ